jgi:phage shock protein B
MFGLGIIELLIIGILVAIFGSIFLAALKILNGQSGGAKGDQQADETRLIQDIYHGLQKMEERIEALETLLLDRERASGGK